MGSETDKSAHIIGLTQFLEYSKGDRTMFVDRIVRVISHNLVRPYIYVFKQKKYH